MEIWEAGFCKKAIFAPSTWKRRGKGFEKSCLKRGLFTWKYEEQVFEKNGLRFTDMEI